MNWNPCQLVEDFLEVAKLAGIEIQEEAIQVEILLMPHERPRLPEGKMAVYVFDAHDHVLKVGQAGLGSETRYRYHHYRPDAAPSVLATSILKDKEAVQRYRVDTENVGNWILSNTDRVNFLLDVEATGLEIKDCEWIITLLEAFVQCRLKPLYEGPARKR